MFNEREARAELRAIELAEALAEQDLQIERQKWQKGHYAITTNQNPHGLDCLPQIWNDHIQG